MSFEVSYILHDAVHVLTGYVGKDGFLYWSASDVTRLLQKDKLYALKIYNLFNLSDVTGDETITDDLEHLVVPHVDAMELLLRNDHGSASVREFARRLDDKETFILSVEKNMEDFLNPTRILMDHENSCVEHSQLFFVWYEFFKIEVMEKFYNKTRDIVQDFMRVFNIPDVSPPPSPEQPNPPKTFPPKRFAMFYEGQFYNYVLED